MGTKTSISWTDATINFTTGCTPVSDGCLNCYASRYAKRGLGDFADQSDASNPDRGKRPFSEVRTHPGRLKIPLHWRKPRRIYVCSMGDLFHDAVPDEFIDKVFAVMALCPQHTFKVLTKRPHRLLKYCKTLGRHHDIDRLSKAAGEIKHDAAFFYKLCSDGWALNNLWLGVTCENQQAADERIPLLLQTPAVVRFVTCEPMLGEIDLSKWIRGSDRELFQSKDQSQPKQGQQGKISLIICGGETGPGARPMHMDWARSLRDQCVAAGIAFHFKSWGEYCYASQILRLPG